MIYVTLPSLSHRGFSREEPSIIIVSVQKGNFLEIFIRQFLKRSLAHPPITLPLKQNLFNKHHNAPRKLFFTSSNMCEFSLLVSRSRSMSRAFIKFTAALVFRYRGALLPDLLDSAGRILFAARCIGFRQIFSFV